MAELNAAMWTELFLDNADNLVEELDRVSVELGRFRETLAQGDAARLKALLEEGSEAKLRADGRYADAKVATL